MDNFTATRDSKWSASTSRNYIINRGIKEVCRERTPLEQITCEFCKRIRSVLQRLRAN